MKEFVVDLEYSARYIIEAETEEEAKEIALEFWEELMPNCYITENNT